MPNENENLNEQVHDSTTVDQVDVNIDEIFGNPGAESIMLPSNGEPEKKSLFSKEDVTDSKEFNLSLSNILTLEVTASARTSNSIL